MSRFAPGIDQLGDGAEVGVVGDVLAQLALQPVLSLPDQAVGVGRPGQAAIDVFEQEPLPPDSPLLRMENVLATPHLGYVEKDGYELYFGAAFQNIIDFARGEPKNVLNPEALEGKASGPVQ